MPDCQHPAIRIQIEYIKHIDCTSMDGEPPISRCLPEQIGPAPRFLASNWSRALLYVRCHDCGHWDTFSSDDWRSYPEWFTRHWLRLVAAGGLPAEIHRHYHMFEEAPCKTS